MSKIDYKAEVLKVYGEAFCQKDLDELFSIVIKNNSWFDVLSKYKKTEPLAWKSAYDEFKSKGLFSFKYVP